MKRLVCAVAALMLSAPVLEATPAAALEQPKLDADPHAVFWAGDHLIAMGRDQQVWRRARPEGSAWRRIELLPEDAGGAASYLACASDRSGVCVALIRVGSEVRYRRLDMATGAMTPLTLTDGAILTMPDRNTVYIQRGRAGGGDVVAYDVVAYDVAAGTETPVGPVAADESVIFYPIGGRLTPVAWSMKGAMRLVAKDATPVKFPFIENLLWLPDGILVRETWSAEPPVVSGRRAVAFARFETAEDEDKPVIRARYDTLGAWPVSGPLFDQKNGAVDGNGDVVVELTGGGVHQIGVLCRDGPGYGFKGIIDLRNDQRTHIVASASGTGFVLRTTDMLRSPAFTVLELSPVAGGWRNRTCAGMGFRTTDSGVAVSTTQGLETYQGEAVSADGTKVPYIVLAPTGIAPDHVIVDVYGAYGYKRDLETYHDMTIDQMTRTRTAIAFGVVRGDGDLGYEYARASRSPDRMKAVEDTIAVAQAVQARYPALKSKPAVRGQSAGAWLAVRSALARPDLFSGAIGYSGIYLMEGDPLASNAYRYFGDGDDLGPVVKAAQDGCSGLRFRFLHARDDFKTSHAKVETFVAQLKAKGCAAEMESFDGGGHEIALGMHQMDDAVRRLKGYFGAL